MAFTGAQANGAAQTDTDSPLVRFTYITLHLQLSLWVGWCGYRHVQHLQQVFLLSYTPLTCMQLLLVDALTLYW